MTGADGKVAGGSAAGPKYGAATAPAGSWAAVERRHKLRYFLRFTNGADDNLNCYGAENVKHHKTCDECCADELRTAPNAPRDYPRDDGSADDCEGLRHQLVWTLQSKPQQAECQQTNDLRNEDSEY